jgi:hypothetical protein
MEDLSALFEGKGAAPAASSLEMIVGLANEVASLDDQIAGINEVLKAAQERKNAITQFELPAALKDAGLTEFKTSPDAEGKYVEIKLVDYISGSLPNKEKFPEKRAEALAYLESDEQTAALIKTQIELEFGKGEHNIALDLAASFKERGFVFSMDSGVHAATLQSYVREALKDGKHVDLEKLGISRMTVAKPAVKVDKKIAKKAAQK